MTVWRDASRLILVESDVMMLLIAQGVLYERNDSRLGKQLVLW